MKHIALIAALASAGAFFAAGHALAFEIYGDSAGGTPLNLGSPPAQYTDPIQYSSHDEGIPLGIGGNRRDYVGEALIPGPVSPGAPAWSYSLRGQ